MRVNEFVGLLVEVPPALRKRAKIVAASQSTTVREIVTTALEKEVGARELASVDAV